MTKEEFKSLARELKLLESCGNALRLPHSRALGKGLFELRSRKFGYRIYYEDKIFQNYLEKRLTKDEISELEKQASLEKQFLLTLQDDVSKAVANLTLASLAQIFALLKCKPHLVFS